MTETHKNTPGNDDPQHLLNQDKEDIQQLQNAIDRLLPLGQAEEIEEEESDPDEDEWPMEEDDHDNSYGSSYEKYNGYNGYSDDVIDDAFEGDPEATWNVD